MATNHHPRARLVVIDDHHAIREILSDALAQCGDLEVVGQAATGREALELCSRTHPDVVLLDAMLPDINGLDCVRAIRRGTPNTRILIFSGSTSSVLISRAVELGVHGYIEKSAPFAELIDAVRCVAGGAAYYGKAITPTLQKLRKSPFPYDAADRLTTREHTVLAGIAAGKSSKVIAAELSLSLFTVNNHRRRIKAKTGLRSTSDLTLHALNLGLVEDPAPIASLHPPAPAPVPDAQPVAGR